MTFLGLYAAAGIATSATSLYRRRHAVAERCELAGLTRWQSLFSWLVLIVAWAVLWPAFVVALFVDDSL